MCPSRQVQATGTVQNHMDYTTYADNRSVRRTQREVNTTCRYRCVLIPDVHTRLQLRRVSRPTRLYLITVLWLTARRGGRRGGRILGGT